MAAWQARNVPCISHDRVMPSPAAKIGEGTLLMKAASRLPTKSWFEEPSEKGVVWPVEKLSSISSSRFGTRSR